MGILDSLTSGLVTAAKTTIYTSIVLGLVAVFGLYYFQTALIYPSNFPVNSRTVVSTPDEFGLPFESVSLLASDGVGLTAYLIKPRGSERAHKVTIVYFHSNAGNMGHRLPIAQQFYQNLDVNVFLLSYRGYGLSQGHANEAGIKLDSIAAIEYVKSHPQLKKTKIVLFGQSIGGAVAIHAASKGRVDGLIVENTFTSLVKVH